MNEQQDMRPAPPPVGWLAYCRLAQGAAPVMPRAQTPESKHADAN